MKHIYAVVVSVEEQLNFSFSILYRRFFPPHSEIDNDQNYRRWDPENYEQPAEHVEPRIYPIGIRIVSDWSEEISLDVHVD